MSVCILSFFVHYCRKLYRNNPCFNLLIVVKYITNNPRFKCINFNCYLNTKSTSEVFFILTNNMKDGGFAMGWNGIGMIFGSCRAGSG